MTAPIRIAVIGGGISGLVAAYHVQRAGHDVHLFEASPRVGGVIQTISEGGYRFECGPNSVQGARHGLFDLCRLLGIESRIVPASSGAMEPLFYHQGALHALPRRLREFLRSPLFTPGQKIRALMEPLIPSGHRSYEPSVAEWVGRRVGRGITMTWVDVMVSGIYAGNPNRLGVRSAFPNLWAMEQEYGSVFRAMRKRSRAARQETAGSGDRPPRMLTFDEGMETLPRCLGAALGERVHVQRRVERLERSGSQFVLRVMGSQGLEAHLCDRVVLAVPAQRAGLLLGPLAPEVADLLFDIEHVSLVTVQAGFDHECLPDLPAAFGYLIPRSSRLRSLGWIFLSKLFPTAAPEGKVAMTGFLGGSLDPHAVDISDEQIRHLLLGELGLALRLRKQPRPEAFRVTRWHDTLPQYNVGHVQRIAATRTLLSAHVPGLEITGNWVDGISIDHCVESGRRAAAAMSVSDVPTPSLP